MFVSTAKTQDPTRQELILSFYPQVQKQAHRLARRLPAHVSLDDLISSGMVALIEAYDRFDASSGVPFGAYVQMRIQGSMLDHLRKQDWVPRNVRHRASELQQTRKELRQQLKTEPSHQQLAARMNLSPKALRSYMKDSLIIKTTSLSAPVDPDAGTSLLDLIAADLPDSAALVEKQQLLQQVKEELARLPIKERTIIELSYLQQQSLKSIGQIFGITEARTSQLRSAALKLLKKRMAKHGR